MSDETVLLIIGAALAFGFALLAWRRFDVKQLSATYESAAVEEPCWTEQISTDGRVSHGRQGCYHAGLSDLDKRARAGEFDTPV